MWGPHLSSVISLCLTPVVTSKCKGSFGWRPLASEDLWPLGYPGPVQDNVPGQLRFVTWGWVSTRAGEYVFPLRMELVSYVPMMPTGSFIKVISVSLACFCYNVIQMLFWWPDRHCISILVLPKGVRA